MADERDVTACCNCLTPGARNVVMLSLRAPVAGTGWGCAVCGLPMDGAIALLCEDCLGRRPTHVVCGKLSEGLRVPVETCTEEFDHTLSENEH